MNNKRLAPIAIVAALLTTLLTGCSTTHYYTAEDFPKSAMASALKATPEPSSTTVPMGAGEQATQAAKTLVEKAKELAAKAKKATQQQGKSAKGTSGDKAKALKQLAGLKVQEANYGVKYNRTGDFGTAWYDYDQNGCDTRNDVLKRDLTNITYKSNDPGCTVATGTYTDPYTGEVKHFVRGVRTSADTQIDHIAPLHYIWMHGGYTWSADKRLRYANDATNVLLAVDGAANMQKSDKGPADWMPSNDAYRCVYVEKFTNALATYGATISRRDAAEVRSVLDTCN